MGVLKESSWNFQQVGVLRIDASSPTNMLRQMCQELLTSDKGKGQSFGFPIFNGNAAVLDSLFVINKVQYSHVGSGKGR